MKYGVHIAATLVALNVALIVMNSYLLLSGTKHHALYLTGVILWTIVACINAFNLVEAWEERRYMKARGEW